MKKLRNFFSDIKTLIAEVIGLFGGFFWAKSTSWDYEPLILFIISLSSLLITIGLLFSKKSNEQLKNSIDAKKILSDIENTSPYLRDQAASNYVGLQIHWEVSFSSIRNINTNIYHVTTLYRGSYPWIYFDIDIEQYPFLKVARKKQNFSITGKIKTIGENTVTIDIEEIHETI